MTERVVRDRSIYAIGDLRVDLGRMALTREDAAIPLEPKAFDVLVHLIEHRDRLVTKDELLDAVWAGTFVTPNALTRAVAQVRKAIGDESQDARFIETVAKRGYRFIAPVTVIEAPALGHDPRVAPVAPTVAIPAPVLTRRRSLRAPIVVTLVGLVMVMAGLAFVRQKEAGPAAAADLHLKRLTNRRGYTGTPALSPDGRAVVYASDVTGGLELSIASLVEGGGEVALTRDGGQNLQPAWSPDGQWIAFHSRRRGGVWIVPATGGVPQQIADFGSDPAWSPDSARLVFTSDAGGLAGQSSLWTVQRDGSDRRALTRIGTPAGGHRAPAWSHDGRLVAFVNSRGGWKLDVWTVEVASGAQHMIDVSANAADPVFAPDDRALLWGGTTLGGNGRLFRHAIDADGGPVGATETVLPMDAGRIDGLSIAADGTMTFAAGTMDANLWAADIGPDARAGQPIRLTDDVSRSTRPEYSRDGRVAYMQTSIGTLASAWVMRDDGSARMPVMPGTAAGSPLWDASADRLLITVFDAKDSRPEMRWVDLASRRMTPSGLFLDDMVSPRLSPDGRALAFHHIEKDGGISLWITQFDGKRTRIATDAEAVSYPAWSPDGQWLAVELKRGDSTQIGVVSREGGTIEQLTSGRGQSWPHSWAPDNDRIAFAGERDGVWSIYSVSRRTRAVTQLTAHTAGTGYLRYPAWSPSGSRVVFERALESSNVWTMTLPPAR